MEWLSERLPGAARRMFKRVIGCGVMSENELESNDLKQELMGLEKRVFEIRSRLLVLEAQKHLGVGDDMIYIRFLSCETGECRQFDLKRSDLRKIL